MAMSFPTVSTQYKRFALGLTQIFAPQKLLLFQTLDDILLGGYFIKGR